MGGRNGPVNDAELKARVPEPLKLLIEAIAVAQCSTVSHIIRSLLETHPTVVWAAERLYNGDQESHNKGD